MPAPNPELTGDLKMFAHAIEREVRQCAVLRADPTGPFPAMGFTHWLGVADVPADANWAPEYMVPESSPHDGPCLWLQVNLEEIPGQARNHPAMPSVGMVWVFIDVSGSRWNGTVLFDPRPAKTIPWHPSPSGYKPEAASLTLMPMLSETVDILEDIGDESLIEEYWNYAQKTLPHNEVYFGGYAWAIQGDQEDTKDTIFCTMPSHMIGDNGVVYLHYNIRRGWWVEIQSH